MTPEHARLFEAKVERVTESGCWIWMASTTSGGYGLVTHRHKTRLAHRVAYDHWRGPIPAGLTLDHVCRVRSCVNPWHLQPVTMRENTHRSMAAPATRNALKTHCLNGHALEAPNLDPYHLARGERRCVICAKARWRRYYHRKRAEVA